MAGCLAVSIDKGMDLCKFGMNSCSPLHREDKIFIEVFDDFQRKHPTQ